ncbi:hypothetical protein [Actinomadura livida]|uniref:Uncharacterized protein n=1 Tax=Actinomadura livida TaxID=79909 RepID=A0A7W7IHW4_9ACTN|nr:MULTISPECIES: hypothetical protein [Actinomadura]MBB4777432.1 hypothetical protein [Actinomadura catellatispora]GGU31601.1 hypothetical protein GCM10010208_65390 [Actinomadura livida]
MIAVRSLRAVWAGRRNREPGRPAERAEYPEAVFLFAAVEAEARRAFDMFPGEARAWRRLAEMEAARSRVWRRRGRMWDAGVCAGRAEAYRAAAVQLEDVLIESLGLWDEYERQAR